MVESLDIQNLLQAGYFSTSRAKSPNRSSSQYEYESNPYSRRAPAYESAHSRRYQITSGPSRFYPPPPSVEDEDVSLKREYGSSVSSHFSEEPPSRGEVEQNPIIMEVHEYNPERRFVILTDPDASDGGKPEKKIDRNQRREERREEKREEKRELKREEKREGKREEPAVPEKNIPRRYEPPPKPEPTLKPTSSSGSDGERPRLEKRQSRQDLPKLETDFREDQLPEKYRNYPPTSNRSEIPPPQPPRPPRPNPESTLPPEVIKHGSSGREKVYHGYGQPQSANRRSPTQRSYPNQPDDRRFEEGHTRASSASSATKRVNSNTDSGKSTRPSSSDRVNDPRYRNEYTPPLSSKKDRSPERKPERDDPSRSSKFQTREPDGRPVEEHPKGPRELQQRQKKPSVVVQDGRDAAPSPEKMDAPSGPRLRPRGPTIPIPVPIPVPAGSGFTDDLAPSTRASSNFPAAKEEQAPPPPPERSLPQLPYPVDDDHSLDPFDIRRREWSGRSAHGDDPAIVMPEIPLPIPIGPETPLEARSASITPQGARPLAGSQRTTESKSWQPPSFDPERDSSRLERPVGAVRRHSENTALAGVPKFPECRRKHPVAGKLDWFTLPRTDFNICPECYEGVFANTEFRNHFKPMIRPMDRPIACDFGVSPWYRIAWLLILKLNKPDLRLFHEISDISFATQNIPCPRDRTTSRNWLTIWNHYTRRPIYDFTICPQCAEIIQALLPNLSGIFVPLDPRSEPTRGTCSMRFKEKRKRFVMYFDAMETTSDLARMEQEEPDINLLTKELEKMTMISECNEDTPIVNGSWHTMQYLPHFTVCGDCFEEVVRPRLNDDNVIARNFYKKPERLQVSTCQLYSPRMREIFAKACRWNDPKYLEDKVLERMEIESVIHDKLKRLDNSNHDEEWVEQQVDSLIQDWKRWE